MCEKWHWRGNCYFLAWDLNPRHSVHWSAALPTVNGSCSSRTSLHILFLVKQSLDDLIEVDEYFIVTCDFIGRRLVMHISKNEIFRVKFPTVCMKCNRIKYCGCRWCLFGLQAFRKTWINNYSPLWYPMIKCKITQFTIYVCRPRRDL